MITGVFVDSAIQTSNSQSDIQIEREMELKDWAEQKQLATFQSTAFFRAMCFGKINLHVWHGPADLSTDSHV